MAANDLSIRLSVKDADTVRSVLRSVGDEGKAALAVLEVASDKSTVSARNLSRQLDTLRASLDPTISAQKQMASAQELLNQALARGADQGGITADEYARLSSAVTERFRAASGEVKAFSDTLTAAAMAAQANYDRLFGVAKAPTASAASSAAVFEQVYAARQQQNAESSQLAYNNLLGVGAPSSGTAAASAAVFEEAARESAAIDQLRARLDPAAASAKVMAEEVATLDGWLAQGKITAPEHAAAMSMVEQAYQRGGVSAGQMTMATRSSRPAAR